MGLWRKRSSDDEQLQNIVAPLAGLAAEPRAARAPEPFAARAAEPAPESTAAVPSPVAERVHAPSLRAAVIERTAALERRPAGSQRTAHIGRSISIKGDVAGDEDLVIEGRVEGRVELKDHQLTIGVGGEVTGEVRAKQVTVLGRVTGNVAATERVEVADSGRVHGDIESPRLLLQEGAQINGKVDMRPPQPLVAAAPRKEKGERVEKPERIERPELERSAGGSAHAAR